MTKEDNFFLKHFGLSYLSLFNIVLFLLLIVYLVVQYYHYNKEKVSAPPVIINNNSNTNVLSSQSITVSENNNPDNPSQLGDKNKLLINGLISGYVAGSLNNPCYIKNSKGQYANLPVAYEYTPCQENLTCVAGIVSGGGICLLKPGEKCVSNNQCAPPNKCINGICQESQEIINKVCASNFQCQKSLSGDIFDHLCYNNLCKYDLFPMDTGCFTDSECYGFEDPNINAICKKGVSITPLVFSSIVSDSILPSIYYLDNLVNLPENIENRSLNFLRNKNNITLTNNNKSYNNCSIYNITPGLCVAVSSPEKINISGSLTTTLSNITSQGKCIGKFPLGTSPPNIPFTNTKYPCQDGLVLSNGYCLEKGRSSKGTSTQICIGGHVSTQTSCINGLECTYQEKTYKTLIDNYFFRNGDLKLKDIENVGNCKVQGLEKFEKCFGDISCKHPNICINGICNTEEDPYNSSSLLKCPEKYTFFGTSSVCLGNKKSFQPCISDENCVGKCSGTCIVVFDRDKTNFSNLYGFDNIPKNSHILMSKNYENVTGTCPSAFGYYYFKSSNEITSSLKIGKDFHDINISLPTGILNPDRSNFKLDILKKNDKTHQLNISYLQKYENYRMRMYEINGSGSTLQIPYTYALKEGSSIAIGVSSPEKNNYYFYELPQKLSYSGSTGYSQGFEFDTTFCGESISFIKGHTGAKLFTYDRNYSILGDSSSVNNRILFSNIQDTDKKIVQPQNFINFGDKVTYEKNVFSQGVSYSTVSGVTGTLLNNDTFYSSLGPTSTSYPDANSVFLTQNYENLNTRLFIDGNKISTGDFHYNITSKIDAELAPCLKLQPSYGMRILPYNIVKNTTTSHNITINKEEILNRATGINDPFGTNTYVQNNPIGYYSGISTFKDIDSEIGIDNIVLTSKLTKDINQTLHLSYKILPSSGQGVCYSPGSSINSFFSYTDTGGTCNKIIKYQINNIISSPYPKINFLQGENSFPNYEIDRVKSYKEFDNTSSSSNILTSYKNIKSSMNNIPIATESKLRKIIPGKILSDSNGTSIQNLRYDNIGVSSKKSNPLNTNTNFGYCQPISLAGFTTTNIPGKNTYYPFLYQIKITNSSDIDAILKYSSSELVIGFKDENSNFFERTWVITKFLEYEVENEIEEYLLLQINISPNSKDSVYYEYPPYLFVNNMIPIMISNNFYLSDAMPLVTSTLDKTSSTGDTRLYNRTYYDKIMTKDSSNNPHIYNILNTISDPRNLPNYYINNYSNFGTSGTSVKVNGLDQGVSCFLINNNFLSFLAMEPYSFRYNHFDFNVNINKNYLDQSGVSRGNINLKINTIPFYTGVSPGKIDLSYKSIINYPNEISSNPYSSPGSSVVIYKTIFENEPGNFINNMNYYTYLKYQDGENQLLYMSNNFVTKSKDFNTSTVLGMSNSAAVEKFSNNSFMTPFGDKKLYILTDTCN